MIRIKETVKRSTLRRQRELKEFPMKVVNFVLESILVLILIAILATFFSLSKPCLVSIGGKE